MAFSKTTLKTIRNNHKIPISDISNRKYLYDPFSRIYRKGFYILYIKSVRLLTDLIDLY
jgi:hypothetical protein